jgi:hypothetical protein
MDPAAEFRRAIDTLGNLPGVTHGSSGKAFGSRPLKVKGRIFAMLTSHGEFVLKLPPGRVQELIRNEAGHAFESGQGRAMKAWVVLDTAAAGDWLALAREALNFVGTQPAKN